MAPQSFSAKDDQLHSEPSRVAGNMLLVLVSMSLSPAQAAKRLGLPEGRILARLWDRTLYQLPQEEPPCLPSFQFSETGLLPGWALVARLLPLDIHPLTLVGFLTKPQDDLQLQDEFVTPLSWLKGGNDAFVVARLASTLGEAP